jgi:lipopolysaccharide export system protein LptA
MKHFAVISLILVMASAGAAVAAGEKSSAKGPVAADQPIEINSDALDVFQPEHKAVFTGNVIAKQGTTTMRAAKMVVFYHADDVKKPLPAAGGAVAAIAPKAADGAAGQGIYRIESTGHVVFTTPSETAQGDTAIYMVDDETIDLTGQSVTLIRDKNVLKGTKLSYNMGTGRSVLTGGVGASGGGKGGRVHGLFVPTPKGDAAKKTGQ